MAKNKLGKLVALSAVVGAGAWLYKKYDTIKSMYHKVSIFKGERYEYEEFDGEAIAAMFSGVMIDLSDVEFTEDEVYLDIYALCSGIRILIPTDVEVVLEGTNNASGIQVDQDEDTEKTRTLYINYNATASGIQVTDNITDFGEGCCSDPECCCDDEECCTDDEECCEEDKPCCCGSEETAEEEATEVQETVVDAFEDDAMTNDFAEVVEEAPVVDEFEEPAPEAPAVDEFVEVAQEAPAFEEVVEVQEGVEAVQDEADDFFDGVDDEVAEVEKATIDEAVNEAAKELDEAAKELDEAIEDYVKEDSMDAFAPVDDDDDFFE